MLTVFLSETVDYIEDNNSYFVSKTEPLMNGNSELAQRLRDIAMQFDSVQCIDENTAQFKSRFAPIAIFPRQLSMGCKTILNIIAHPDTVFTLLECGDNAKDYIYNLSDGMVLDEYIHYGDYRYTVKFDSCGFCFETNSSEAAEQWLEGIEHDSR